MAAKRKGGNGRKKTVLGPILKKDARHVCFSKRRRGLFSKASTLAMLSGAEVAAIVFSPGGKVFSFGHSSVDAVVNRFTLGDSAEAQHEAAADGLQTLHRQHGEMRTELAERKKRKKRAEEALAQEHAAGDQIAAWLDPDARDMGYEDMAAFAATLMQVQAAISVRANQVLVEAYHIDICRKLQVPPPPPPPLQLFGATTFEFGSSSSANAGMDMAMPPAPGFAPGMDMHQMLMVMPPPPRLAAVVEIQQGLMAVLPPPPEFPAVMGMQQLVMEMPPQPGFGAGMVPLQEFVAGMVPLQEFAGLGPNAGFPY